MGAGMRPALLAPLSLGLAALLLSGCVSGRDDRFPSLAIRPAERVSGSAEPVEAAPPRPTTVPAATESALDRLRREALEAHQRFEGQRGRAATLTASARGAAVASESWSVAQVALADLEATRSQAMIALADLDRLYIAAWAGAAMTGGSAELDAVGAARDEVTRRIGEEDAALAGLRSRLRE
jgi:hypothetical protein